MDGLIVLRIEVPEIDIQPRAFYPLFKAFHFKEIEVSLLLWLQKK